MLYCLNPACSAPDNSDSNTVCQGCSANLAESIISFTFDHYNVVRLLGQGAFGRTYLAQDLRLKRELRVIKKFIAQAQGEALKKAIELFEREAEHLYELKNTQIPKLYAYFEQNNSLYLVEEYIQGEDLSKEFQREGRFSEEKIIRFLEELLPVLAYLHENKVLHRDIKPENIMRRRVSATENSLILIDFGGAKVVTETVQNQQGTAVYTPGYAAVEHMMGRPKPTSDIYSLGVTAIRLLTGCFPQYDQYGNCHDALYNEDHQQWLWREILQQQGRGINEGLGKILAKMIQPLAKDRYQTAGEVLEALNNLNTIPSATPVNPPPQPLVSTVVLQPPLVSTVISEDNSQSLRNRKSPVINTNHQTINRQKFLKWASFSSLGLITAVGGGFLWRNSQTDSKTRSTFSFETVTVDKSGQIIKRKQKSAEYITLDLGDGVTMDLVYIAGGRFLMGAPATEKDSEDNERPQHWVTVPAFYMGKYQVTQAQWQAIMGTNPAYFPGENRPVEQVSWDECVEFCEKVAQKTGKQVRLPSEAEWEYACRAIFFFPVGEGQGMKATTPFNFGETITGDLANYNATLTYQSEPAGEWRRETTPVGQFPPNAFGLYDMHGNVWEWCADSWHDSYNNAPRDGSAWVSANNDYFVLRGGSWDFNPRNGRSANRDLSTRANQGYGIGFRLVGSIP